MNKTGNTLEEELARTSIDSLIEYNTNHIIDDFRDEELSFVRVIILTDVSEEGFRFLEKKVAVDGSGSRKDEKILQEESHKYGANIISQDTTISVVRGATKVFMTWISDGKVSYALSFPLHVDIDQMRAIANDPKADFRRVNNLLGVKLRSLV